jgi:hypothetical protein
MSAIDERRLSMLSDTRLYPEAATFLSRFLTDYELPPTQQLIGLLTFSRNWTELMGFVKHQEGRDWGNKESYKQFYAQLRRYLDDSKTGLRPRVKAELGLVPDGLTARGEREIHDLWAGALAREFIQHLVAEALYQAQGRKN